MKVCLQTRTHTGKRSAGRARYSREAFPGKRGTDWANRRLLDPHFPASSTLSSGRAETVGEPQSFLHGGAAGP